MIAIKTLGSPDASRYVAVHNDGLWYVMVESPTDKYDYVAEDDPRYSRLPNYSTARSAIQELEKEHR